MVEDPIPKDSPDVAQEAVNRIDASFDQAEERDQDTVERFKRAKHVDTPSGCTRLYVK
jgi:hypothetical protein